ncbi:D-alanyl-D-alanine carboxypeptidase family protein [Petroclostridium sp. X23]|uniref:D-alanyl-D-alanine carboxypeptidase family protein n=1 Tax=Petroclostridium sp. X23 TaxID=3045146 RepID=UPI0024AD71CF|nr:D-alanyl-D-alanine carboxypeptidase family protein [Petroclostridium sp. X23]WHH59445.1 D-alanyl-D-alanine carboxypeptidase family protein [Petroclostridium sp. X23]
MRKISLLLVAIMMVSIVNIQTVLANTPDVSAASAVVMDTVTGRVIFEKNAHKKRTMASITKIMTAVIALENGNLNDIVVTSPNAAHAEGSSIWLEEGEKQKLEDLIYGLMLSSGNDAAIAIAEHIAGSVDEFAKIMTQKAKDIGAINTNFKNPNGLDEEGHYTTAYDFALITRYALKNDKFAEIVKTEKRQIPWEGHKWNRVLTNHNKLLKMYEGCDGVKTGYTKKSGRTLVSSATRDGWQVVAVTLNAPNDWEDHKKMFDYAFDRYKIQSVCEEGDFMKTIPVLDGKKDTISLVASASFQLPIMEGEKNKVEVKYDVPDYVMAPVNYGQEIGKIDLYLEDIKCGSIPLAAIDNVERKDVKMAFEKITKSWMMMFSNREIILKLMIN